MDDSEGPGERLLILHHGPDHWGIQRGAGFIRKHTLQRGERSQGVTQKGQHGRPVAPYQTTHSCLPQKNRTPGWFSKNHQQSESYESRLSVFSAALEDPNIAGWIPTKQLEVLVLFSLKNKITIWRTLALHQAGLHINGSCLWFVMVGNFMYCIMRVTDFTFVVQKDNHVVECIWFF